MRWTLKLIGLLSPREIELDKSITFWKMMLSFRSRMLPLFPLTNLDHQEHEFCEYKFDKIEEEKFDQKIKEETIVDK